MLTVSTLFTMKQIEITSIEQLGEVLDLDLSTLSGPRKIALMRVIRDNDEYYELNQSSKPEEVIEFADKHTTIKNYGDYTSKDIDERGNITELTIQETELSLNPFYNENYALNQLTKVKQRAIREKVLDVKFKTIQLTYHDVPTNQNLRWMNVRAFTGEVMFPRLTKRYRNIDRVRRKIKTVKTDVDDDYLGFRRQFLEPTAPNQPERRGRKELEVKHDIDFTKPGILSPNTEHKVEIESLDVPSQLARRTPGKGLFIAPSEDDDDLTNKAEDSRRTGGFPFGAGPSGSMAYDLAVYKYYLVHWKQLGANSSECREKLLMFGISRAIGYVKYGHHSFYETLITLHDLVDQEIFSTPDQLYPFIVSYIELGFRTDNTKYRDVQPPPERLQVYWDSYLADWLDWRAYNLAGYATWKIQKGHDGPTGLLGQPILQGKYIYVILALDKSIRYLPTSLDGEQYRSHSQLAGGTSVLAAGYFELGDDNQLVWIDNSSGHYKPGPDTVGYARRRFGKIGFDVSKTEERKHVPGPGDREWLPWFKQQLLVGGRILKGWAMKTPGRTRSFPEPPQELLPYMPY